MTWSPAHEGDGADHDADGDDPHHGGGAGEDRTGRVGGSRRRGVPQADAPADRGKPSEITNGGWLLDSDQLAQWLGTTERFVRRLVSERRIPHVKLGKQVRFDPADVIAWVEGCKVAELTVTPFGEVRGRKGRKA